MQSVSELDQLCSLSLTQLGYQEKLQLEERLSTFCRSLQSSNLYELFSQIQESSILVVVAILRQNIPAIQQPVLWLRTLLAICEEWLSPGIVMVRRGKNLLYATTNSLRQLLGELTKLIYYNSLGNSASKAQFQAYIKSLSPPVRIFQLIAMIESMSLIDYELGFLQFRNLLYNFQKDWIPLMFKQVDRILKTLSHHDELKSITSHLQSSLTLLDTQHNTKQNLPFSSLQFHLAQKVTQLLGHLTQFNYNITHNEYQKHADFDDSPVQYPQTVINIIVKENLYVYAQAVIKRLISQFPDLPLTKSFLQCFIKLSSPAVEIVDFKKMAIQTCIFIMNQKVDINIGLIILDLNVKLIKNLVFHSFFAAYEELTIKWINLLVSLAESVFRNTNVSYSNIHIDNIKTIFNVVLTASGKKELHAYRLFFKKVSESIFMELCGYLFSTNRSLLSDNIQDYFEMESSNKEYFSGWNPIVFLSNASNIQRLFSIQSTLLSHPESLHNISNFNLMLGYFVKEEEECFRYNVHLEDISREVKLLFGRMVMESVGFLKKVNMGVESMSFNGSLLYFFNCFLERVVMTVETVTNWRSRFVQDFELVPVENIQTAIVECFQQIARWVVVNNSTMISYVLKCLLTHIQSLNKIYEGSFTASVLYKDLIGFYLKVAAANMKSAETIKCRKHLFENLTLLVFIKEQCSYKEKFMDLFGVISNSQYLNDELKILAQIYDIRGIVEFITKQQPLEEFCQISSPLLTNLNQIVFASSNHVLIKKTLKLYNSYFKNIGGRFFGKLGGILMTSIYELVLPYWAKVLNEFNSCADEDVGRMLDVVAQVFTGFRLVYQDGICNPMNHPEFPNLVITLCSVVLKRYLILSQEITESYNSIGRMTEVIGVFQTLSRKKILEVTMWCFTPESIRIFFEFHAVMIKTSLIIMKKLQRTKQHSDRELSSLRSLSKSIQQIYKFVSFKVLDVPPDMKLFRPNRIHDNTAHFLHCDRDNIMNVVISDLFKKSCCNRPTSHVFEATTVLLRSLLKCYPESQGYVNGELKNTFQNAHSEQKLDYIYKSLKVSGVESQQFDRSASCDDMEAEGLVVFEPLLIDWISSVDKNNIEVDEY